jgi:hypothetical protein
LHYTQTTNNPPPSHAFIKSLWWCLNCINKQWSPTFCRHYA